jgi:hypothetical protein
MAFNVDQFFWFFLTFYGLGLVACSSAEFHLKETRVVSA